MAKEKSPYEGTIDFLGGKICLARVLSVNTEDRSMRVATLGSPGQRTDDLAPRYVKIAHTSWHVNGSYGVYVPQVGEYILMTFINSQPVAICSYPLNLSEGGGSPSNQKDQLVSGDYGWVTAIGSKAIIRSGGTIEIQASPRCFTYWLMKNNTLTSVCDNLETATSGGHLNWLVDQETQDTTLELKAYDSASSPENSAQLQIGTTDSDAFIDLAVGPVDPDTLEISTPTLTLQIQGDGTTDINIGSGKFTLSVTPEGDVSVVNNQTTTDTKADVTATIGGNFTATISGDAKTVASGSAVLQGKSLAIGDGSTELLQTLSDLIDALGNLQIPTVVGPSGPVNSAPLWSQVTQLQNKIKGIAGSF